MRAVLCAVLGTTLLSACGTVPQAPSQEPSVLAIPVCEEPVGDPRTNGELAAYAQALRDALRGCNRALEAFREQAGLGE